MMALSNGGAMATDGSSINAFGRSAAIYSWPIWRLSLNVGLDLQSQQIKEHITH